MIPSVRKGEKFKPSAAIHNEIAETINRMNGFQSGNLQKGQSNEIRITFVNTIAEEIPAGAPVVIDSYNAKLDLFTVRKYRKKDTVFGVVKSTVKEKKIGTAVIVGIAQIKVSGEEKKCVAPVEDEFTWEYSEQGFPVLCPVSDGVLILAGNIMSGAADIKSNRPFFATYNPETEMIDITGGWVLANGEYLTAKADSVGVQNGYICVTAENVNGKYKDPTFKYGTFGLNCIPIASVSVKDGLVNIINLYVSTAVMLETDPHPPCDCVGNGGI
jgi:hypothetical protein